MDMGDLVELAKSIRQKGDVDVPLKVRQNPNGSYEIVWGHRRYHAAMLAGLKTISALVEDLEDEEALKQHVIENMHRKEFTPIEEAELFNLWKNKFNKTYDEIAKILGIRREYIYNRVELLKLAPEVRTLLKKISNATNGIGLYGARLLLKVKDPKTQYKIAEQTLRENLSTRDLKKKINEIVAKTANWRTANTSFEEISQESYHRLLDVSQKIVTDKDSDLNAKIEIINSQLESIQYRRISLPTHIMTHIDTPHMFFPDGKCIDDYPSDSFKGKGYIAAVETTNDNPITPADLSIADKEKIEGAKFLFLSTGHASKFGTSEYEEAHPYISDELAEWIISMQFTTVGIDTPSPDAPRSMRKSGFQFPIHRRLLSEDILIVENLGDVREFSNRKVNVVLLPLIIKNLDEAPTNVLIQT